MMDEETGTELMKAAEIALSALENYRIQLALNNGESLINTKVDARLRAAIAKAQGR